MDNSNDSKNGQCSINGYFGSSVANSITNPLLESNASEYLSDSRTRVPRYGNAETQDTNSFQVYKI